MRCVRCLISLDETEDELATLCDDCIRQRASIVPALDVEAVFARGGPLDRHPGYEARPGQVRLARAIANATMGTSDAPMHHLLAEGPCGIGKSKAYGIPAAWLAHNDKKVLIVTASIALQEQLVRKDLPALQAELPFDFTFGLMKGKSNYACLSQLEVLDDAGLTGQEREQFITLRKWSATTATGDKSELDIKPADSVWSRFSTSSEACPGKKCSNYRRCYATRARNAAADAGILVTNYHLFFLNMAYGGTLLPASDVVILDEAHEAADIARDLLGFRITEGTFSRYARDAEKRDPGGDGSFVGNKIRTAAAALFNKLLRFHDSGHYAKLLRWAVPIACDDLVAAIDLYAHACAKSHLVDHALTAVRRLDEGLALGDANCVYSIDVNESQRGGRRAALVARYVNPAPVLASQLWGGYSSVVAVSATITTDNKFTFARAELGAPAEARELQVETPFDFSRQALLIVPPSSSLPEPNDAAFLDAAAGYVLETIHACGGRTLGLFTSYRAVNAVFDRITRELRGRYTVLRQGDAPPSVLAQRFKEDERSVLLGTSSFWTGIDVPGEALTGLVIDRLPFGSPDDPVTIRLTESNPRAFAEYTTPRAILQFRQGVGRLIRSQRDVGTIVLLDRRLTTKGYGTRFLSSLPAMRRAQSTSAIAPFLRAAGVAA